jgi:hypothetical protein
MHESILINRRQWLFVAPAALLTLPACSEFEDARRARDGKPPLTPEQRRLRHKFKDLRGGELVVDAFGEKDAVTIFDEQGRVFYTRAVVSPRNRTIRSYGAEFGVPVTLRAMWRREGERVGGVLQNPIRGTGVYGTFSGGKLVGDHIVPVAERIPDELLTEMRKRKLGLRIKLRIHPDGVLLGWDLQGPPGTGPNYGKYTMAGGDFQEADIYNGKALRMGWYIHPKTRARIETPF